MAETIKLLLADDHTLFRQGVLEILDEEQEFEVLGVAADGGQAVEKAQELKPDVILMDVHMPQGGGVQAVRMIKASLDCRVLMLTVSSHDQDLLAAIDAGADGYLLKNAEPEALFRAIRDVAAGRGALSPEVTRTVMLQAAPVNKKKPPIILTERELEVLELVAQGETTAEIARDLSIASSTVKTHVQNFLRKLKAANRTEAVALALELGILNRD
jgi:DNA-binding NarL/FixJ family response regulator